MQIQASKAPRPCVELAKIKSRQGFSLAPDPLRKYVQRVFFWPIMKSRFDIIDAMQTKHETEIAAREAAVKLGNQPCEIVESKEGGAFAEGPFIFYLESGEHLGCAWIRPWERLVYDGPGSKAVRKSKRAA